MKKDPPDIDFLRREYDSGRLTWSRFFAYMLDFDTPDEIEKRLRDGLAAGELGDMPKKLLEQRLKEMKKIAASRGKA